MIKAGRALLAAAGVMAACVVAAAAPQATAPPSQVLTLDQAIKAALEGNQGLRLQREAVQKALGFRAQALAARMPQLQLQSAHIQTGPISTVTFPGPSGPVSIQLGTPETTATSLALTQLIDISHLFANGIKITDLNITGTRLDLGRSEQQVVFGVKQAYFGVLQTQAIRDVAQETLQADEEHLRVARLQYEAGTVPHFDVLRAEVAVADARQRLVSASNGVDLAKAAVNNILGADVNRPIEVEPMPEYSRVELELPPLQAQAERSRPDLHSADLRIAIADRLIYLARAGKLPGMALTGSYSYTAPTSAFGPQNLTWAVTLAANLPIFDGGTTAAKVAQARSDLRSAQAGREQLRQGIALDVRQAYLSVREAQARLEATAKSVEEAREAVRLAEARYAAGVGTSVEVTDAVAAFTGASTNNVTAIYDARISLARLDNAVGTPIGPGATGAAK